MAAKLLWLACCVYRGMAEISRMLRKMISDALSFSEF